MQLKGVSEKTHGVIILNSMEDPRDLRDVSEETSLIYLTGDVSEICKSALFEMSLRRCMRRLRDASVMHPCRLGMFFLLVLKLNLYKKAFSRVKTKTNFCHKPCWNAERSNHSFLSNWWISFFKHLYPLIMWQYNI